MTIIKLSFTALYHFNAIKTAIYGLSIHTPMGYQNSIKSFEIGINAQNPLMIFMIEILRSLSKNTSINWFYLVILYDFILFQTILAYSISNDFTRFLLPISVFNRLFYTFSVVFCRFALFCNVIMVILHRNIKNATMGPV